MSLLRVVIAAMLVGSGGSAGAGALSKVVGGLKEKTGQSESDSNSSGSTTRDHRGSSDSDSSSDSSDSSSSDSSRQWVGHNPHYHPTSPGFFIGGYPYPTTGDAEVSLYVGVHAVEASDGAATVALRASYGDLGIELSDTSYYERDESGRSEFITLDVWSLGFAYRAIASGSRERTAVWVKGGLAGANSDGLDILGAMAGAEVAHNFTTTLGVDTSARLFAYQDGVRGVELRTGVALSIMRLSYRVLKFNVGPPLRGPEVGVALSF